MNAPISVIIACWVAIIVLMISAAAFFFLGKSSAAVKRRVFRWYIVVGGILVNCWFLLVGGPAALWIGIPGFAVAAYLCARTTRFCDACGAALMNQFTRVRFCTRCGADLDAQNDSRRTESEQHD